MAIEGNVNLPTSGSECTEGIAPQHFHNHVFMPPKPAFTRQEEWHKTLHAVNSALAKVIGLENECREKVDSMLSVISSDNVEFKNLMTSAYNDFANTVKNEVNSFESLISNSYDLFSNTMESDFLAFKQDVNTATTEFENSIIKRVQEINNYFVSNFNGTVRQELRKMKLSGELSEVLAGEAFNHLATKTDIDTLSNRVDSLLSLEEGGESSAEVVDIRTASNAHVYPSAGAAVRAQANQSNEKIDYVTAIALGTIRRVSEWENRNHSGTTSTRIMSEPFLAVGNLILDVEEGYDAGVAYYRVENDELVLISTTSWYTGRKRVVGIAPGVWYRVILRRNDDSDITLDYCNKVTILEEVNKDNIHANLMSAQMNIVDLLAKFEPSRNIFTGGNRWIIGTFDESGKESDNHYSVNAIVPNFMPIEAESPYVLSWSTENATNLYIYFYTESHEFISLTKLYNISGSGYKAFTTPETAAFYRMKAYNGAAENLDGICVRKIQIEKGVIPTEYIDPFILRSDCLGSIANKNESIALAKSNTVRSIAHRGEPVNHPQCTKPAYVAAKRLGFDVAENDLMTTSDGVLVMWHDSTLGRLGNLLDINGYEMYVKDDVVYYYNVADSTVYTYEDGYHTVVVDVGSMTRMNGSDFTVATLPFATLRRIDFGYYKGSDYKGTTILTFEEWVSLCKILGMEMYIDKKISLTDSIVSEMSESLIKLGMADRASWMVSNSTEIDLVRKYIPGARLIFLWTPDANRVESYKRYLTDGRVVFNPQCIDVNTETAMMAITAGYELECWHVDYAGYGFNTREAILDEFLRVMSLGVTGITSDMYKVEDAIQYFMDEK